MSDELVLWFGGWGMDMDMRGVLLTFSLFFFSFSLVLFFFLNIFNRWLFSFVHLDFAG